MAWNSSSSSPGRNVIEVQVNPDLVAFREAMAFPASVLGPVECLELAMQAAYFAAEIGRLGFGFWRGGSHLTTTMGSETWLGYWAALPPVGPAAGKTRGPLSL